MLKKRAVAYYFLGRRVAAHETSGWSSPTHWLGSTAFRYWETVETPSYVVDVFVA